MEDFHSVSDRCQRVAKFVGQCRQELVLAAVDFAQRLLRLLTVSNVEDGAAHPNRSAGFVEGTFTTDLGPTHTAIQIEHAKFVVVLSGMASRLERGLGTRAIVRMYACEPGFIAQVAFTGVSAEQSPRFVGP